MRIHLLVLISLSIFVVSCMGNLKKDVSRYSIQEAGVDSNTGDFCQDFRLSSAQIKQFFQQKNKVESKVIHDRYDYLPCYIRGAFVAASGQQCSWEIRAGGTGHQECGASVSYYACEDCF